MVESTLDCCCGLPGSFLPSPTYSPVYALKIRRRERKDPVLTVGLLVGFSEGGQVETDVEMTLLNDFGRVLPPPVCCPCQPLSVSD